MAPAAQRAAYLKVACGEDAGLLQGVEALLRWPHPARGLIPPDQFIPIAEQTGLIGPLTDWVLETALQQHANKYKVWNLSLGTDSVCSLDEFSELAEQLDNLQEKYQVSFVISAGNYQTLPLLDFPRTPAQMDAGRITSPADSVLGIAVGSVSHVDYRANGPKLHQARPGGATPRCLGYGRRPGVPADLPGRPGIGLDPGRGRTQGGPARGGGSPRERILSG